MKNLYGHESGDHIRLVKERDYSLEALEKVLLSYSCYPPAIPKIHLSLAEVGHYECFVQPLWFRDCFTEVTQDLFAQGIRLEVISLNSRYSDPLR